MANVVLRHIIKTFQGTQKTAVQDERSPSGIDSVPLAESSIADATADYRLAEDADSTEWEDDGSETEDSDDERPVLDDISLTVQDGEFMVLVGPSGCGKSTLLRLISGLETLTSGRIFIGDRPIDHLPPKQRDIAMVFQSYALYPHLSVYDNLAFGLRRMPSRDEEHSSSWWERALVGLSRPLPKSFQYESEQENVIRDRVRTVADMLQITPLLDRLPKQLSGGQKQRVALGRAMARNPQVFLMDEPLSNLDAKLRTETRAQIVNLQRKLGTTTIYVTHDQTEAMTMGDRIAVMNQGVIQQVAPPLTLYHQPANQFVAAFIGSPPMNFLQATVKFTADAPQLIHPCFAVPLPVQWMTALKPYQNTAITLGIRPEHIAIGQQPGAFAATILQYEALGSETYAVTQLNGVDLSEQTLQVRLSADIPVERDSVLQLSIPTGKLHIFDPNTGIAIRLKGK